VDALQDRCLKLSIRLGTFTTACSHDRGVVMGMGVFNPGANSINTLMRIRLLALITLITCGLRAQVPASYQGGALRPHPMSGEPPTGTREREPTSLPVPDLDGPNRISGASPTVMGERAKAKEVEEGK
jgi:hypothetical protein